MTSKGDPIIHSLPFSMENHILEYWLLPKAKDSGLLVYEGNGF